MIKNSQRQIGSAHVVIVIVLVLVLIGALGFIVWQNFIDKENTKVESVNTTSQIESTEDLADKEDALTEGSFDGETGTLQAKGYLYTQDVPEPYCETNCATYKRAFFYISESPNQAIATFIAHFKGNAFVADSAIALGCVIDGEIQATGTPSGNKVYSSEVSRYLINSSKAEPVSVEIGRSVVPNATDAPVCYSHFDSISAL